MSMESFTLLVRHVLGFVILRNPTRSVIGIGFGLLIYILIGDFSKYLPSDINYSIFSKSDFMLLGALLSQLPAMFRRELPQEIDEEFRAIEKAKKASNLSDAQVRLLYMSVVSKFIKNNTFIRPLPQIKTENREGKLD